MKPLLCSLPTPVATPNLVLLQELVLYRDKAPSTYSHHLGMLEGLLLTLLQNLYTRRSRTTLCVQGFVFHLISPPSLKDWCLFFSFFFTVVYMYFLFLSCLYFILCFKVNFMLLFLIFLFYFLELQFLIIAFRERIPAHRLYRDDQRQRHIS